MTFGFAVDFHFCGGEYYSVSFFGEQAQCGMVEATSMETAQCQNEHDQACSKSCCENSTFLQDGVFQNEVLLISIPFDYFNLSDDVFDFCIEKEHLYVSRCESYFSPPEFNDGLNPELLQVYLI